MEATPPPPHQPPPGWYPDPTGQQRYWNGQAWKDEVAAGPKPDQAKSRRRFVKIAVASAVTFVMSFVLMQLTFQNGAVWLQVLGFALFAVWLVSGVVTLVAIVGAIVGRLK
jgi:hypothetical protein